MWLKMFFIHSENIQRDSYIWNTIGSIFLSFQSVMLLMVLTRTVNLADAGIFSIAFANATLFLNLGKYGMRAFQVSDAKRQFSFAEYCASRPITVLLMLIASAIYDVYSSIRNQYTFTKALIIFLMCVFKAADAVEDVYTSFYQQNNRLDIGAKVTTVRIAITTFFFGICLAVLRNLLFSLIFSTVLTYLMFFVMIRQTNEIFGEEMWLSRGFVVKNLSGIVVLLRICFPLFASAFLSYYIGNAPKYAIDSILNDELQACYGFISLPVSVVGLLSNFIFYPVLHSMAQLWNDDQIARFLQRFLLQVGIVSLITLACFGASFLFGIPILSLLYHTDLTPYKFELMVLMAGGGFLGFSGLLGYVITIIRRQKWVLWIYTGVTLLALSLSGRIVRHFALTGAAVLYTALMGILCVGLVLVFTAGVLKQRSISIRSKVPSQKIND